MLERTIFVLGEIFSTKLNVLMLFVGSFKTCENNQCFNLEVFLKIHSISYFITSLVAPGLLMTVIFLDFGRMRLLILLSIEPTMMTMMMIYSSFLELFLLSCSNKTLLLQFLFNSSKFWNYIVNYIY